MRRMFLPVITLFFLFLISIPFVAIAGPANSDVEWFVLFMGLTGGLALFLAGLEQLSDGLKKAAGKALKIMLARLTSNRLMGALTGAVMTGILNSSSITTVLVVGFVTAGIMTLSQSIGVIMGANIGSTVTAQILAFNVSKYALLPVAAGFLLIFTNRTEKLKYTGMMLMGIGLVFFGMSIMSQAMAPLRSYQPFIDLLARMENPLFGILAGAVFTGLVQSSAATVGISIALAAEGFLTLEVGIALALGANIGTCVTALLAALGKPTEAVRAAVVHVIFNIIGVLLWIFFIPHLAMLATWFSPSSPELAGAARMAAEVPRQIANANTLFNVANTCLFLPFTAFFAWLACHLIPSKPPELRAIEPLYLDSAVLDVPSLALERVRQELARTGEIIHDMFFAIKNALRAGQPNQLKDLWREDDKVNILEDACIKYLGDIRHTELTQEESRDHQMLLITAVALENIGDVIKTNLVELTEKEIGIHYTKSKETSRLTESIFVFVSDSLALVCKAVRDNDEEAAREILDFEPHIVRLQHDLMVRKSKRLGSNNQDAINLARIEISVASKLKRMYNLTKRIASEIVQVIEEQQKKDHRSDESVLPSTEKG